MALTANQDWLYKQMSGMNVDLGSEEQFAQAMQDESNRQWVYDQAVKMGIDLGTPDQFASAMQMPEVAEVREPEQAQPAAHPGVSSGGLLSEQEELAHQNAIQGVTDDPYRPHVEGEKLRISDVQRPQDYEGESSFYGLSDEDLNKQIGEYDQRRTAEQEALRQQQQNRKRSFADRLAAIDNPALQPAQDQIEVNNVRLSDEDEERYARLQQEKVWRERNSESYQELGDAILETRKLVNSLRYQYGRNIDSGGASAYLDKAIELYQAPSKYGQQNGFKNWAEGLGAQLSDYDTYTLGVTEAFRAGNMAGIVKKLNKGENLTDQEQANLQSFLLLSMVEQAREQDLSTGYTIGKQSAESIPFMLEMLATAGLGAAGEKALVKSIVKSGNRHLAERVARIFGDEYMITAARKKSGKIVKDIALNRVEQGLLERGARQVGEDVLMTAAMPTTWASVNNDRVNEMLFGDDHDYGFMDFMRSFTSATLETGTERWGGKIVDKTLNKVMPLDKIWGKHKWGKLLSNDFIQSPLGETGEEYINAMANAIRSVNPAYSDKSNAQLREEAEQMFTPAGFAQTFLTVAPMSAFGGMVNLSVAKYKLSQYNNGKAQLTDLLTGLGASTEQAENIIRQIESSEDTSGFAGKVAETERILLYNYQVDHPNATKEEYEAFKKQVDKTVGAYFKGAAYLNELTGELRDAYATMSEEDKQRCRDAWNEYVVAEFEDKVPEETVQETNPLSPAASEHQRAMDEVTQAVRERTHGNGYIYPVAMPGNSEKTGYIVGEVVPVIDESNPEQLKIENDDVVTVKWSDGTVTQERAMDLDLTGAPMMAQQAIDIEVENQMYAYTQQRIQNGEQPVLMRNGEGILEGFFPTEGGLLEDQNGVQYTPEQLAEQGWQETKPVLFVNDTQQIAALDNGDGTYTQVDALGNPIAEPMSAEAFREQGFAMVLLEEENPKSQAPIEAPVVQQAPVEQASEVQETTAPIVPNIETMSAEELGGSAVEYMGDRASAIAYLEEERDKANEEVQRTSKLKVTRFNGPEDFKRQNDQIKSAKRAAIDRYNKLQNAITAANAYKTLAEQKEEAERKAREAALREQRRQLAEAETAGDIEAKWQNTKKTVGFAASKTLPNGQKVNGHYILTEAGDVVPSHDPRKNYADSEGYVMENGQNVNDNNYKDPDVQRIALDIAQNYGGQAVEQMPFLENRAGRVLSGNNRTISGIIAAENNTDQAYLAALAENAQQYGFTPEQLAEYEHPRLQFVVEDELPFTTATFAMFNQQEKKTKSSVNRAVANSKMVTEAVRDKMLEIMDQYESLDSFFGSESAAADIVQALITEGLMTQQEVAGLTENTGSGFKFGQSGREYVTDMLLGTLFDEQTIKMLAGEKTLKQAILRALPSIVANRRLKGYELTDSINNAIQLLYEARKTNESKSTADAFQLYLRQVDAFKGSIMDRYNGFDIILANRMSTGVEQLREILGLYNNSAMNEANGQMGFFEPRTIDDIKQDVYEYYTNQQPELAAVIDGAAARGAQPESAVPGGVADAPETRQQTAGERALESAEEAQAQAEREEFISLVNQYLTSISSKETRGVLFDNNSMVSLFRELGFQEEMIQAIEEAQNEGDEVKVRGFNHNGVVFLNVDAISTPEDARNNYVHERQHSLTLSDSHWVGEVMKATSEEELTDLLNNHTKNHYYDNKTFVEKADEFISYAMEIAYSVANNEELERALKDMGANDALINIIKSINDEQRKDNDLSLARRTPFVDGRNGGDRQQNGGDRGTRAETGLEPEGAGSAESGTRGTEGGAEQVTASDEWLNSELGKNYQELRKLYPRHIPVLRVGNEYHLYSDEAIVAGKVLGIEPTSRRGTSFISFPHKELEKALPELIRAGYRVAIVNDIEKPEATETPTDNRETSETRATETEIGGALVDRLGDMGVSVSTDLEANRDALKAAKADKSEAGAIHYYKTPSGQQYGFSYKGKVYLDPTKINAELPIHEYGHLWSEAMRRISPESWRSVVDTIKADQASWDFVRALRPELTDENEIAEEVIATFSGKRGAERLRAEYKKMHGKDADYKSKWGNIFRNISKAIQDFWKAVGDFLNIKYQSAEQIYDQVLKDFVENMNPYQKVRDFLRARDAEYIQAAERGDIQKATNIFYDALRENIGNGITPYMSVGTYLQFKRLAKGVKTRDAAIIREAAENIAPLIPDNAVLVPTPSHTGRATDMLDLANAIAEITGSEVADILRSAPRESQYQAKKETGTPIASQQLGIMMDGNVPADKTAIVIDNVVDSGNTAEACIQALGKGVVVTLADSAEQYRHAASIRSAAPILRDKDGNIVPLTKRFNLNGSRYLGRRMYLRPNDPRFSISGTQVIPVGEKTLVGMHNISAEKLRKVMKAGGLANPSAAVIDISKQDHHDYGEVSLVLPSSLVERADGTYPGDAWTPMYPPVEYRAGKDTEKRIKELTKGLPDNLASAIALRIRDYMDGNSRNSGMEYIYLKEQGRELPIEHTPRRYPYISIKQIADRLGIDEPEYWSSDVYQAYEQLPDDQLFDFNLWLEQNGNQEEIDKRKAMVERWRSEGKDSFANTWVGRQSERMSFAAFDSAGYRILRDERDAGEENTGMTLDKASYIVDTEGLRPEFETWLQHKIDGLGYEEVLFGGYTPSGNRRWLPNTVENASKLMNQKSQTNYLERESVNETKAMLMEKFRTLSQIRKHRDILEPDREKIKAAYEAVSSDWNQLGMDFRDYTQTDKRAYQLDDNPFIAIDTALARIQEAMFKADPIAFLNREYRYSLPANSEFGTRIKEIKERIKNLPSRYFETKFRRPVYLDEFANAVVPVGLPQDLRDGLTGAGMTLFEYDPAEQGSRRAATLKATADEGIRFSISGNTRNRYAEEMESIKNEAVNNGTFMQAPNGKPTNLDERQWLQVRLRSFKRWFGDWENDPKNASKVVDENGEPMVVVHTTPAKFTTFKRGERAGLSGKGIYFAVRGEGVPSYGGNRIEAFLNVRNPLTFELIKTDQYKAINNDGRSAIDPNVYENYPEFDGVMVRRDEITVKDPNQIKSATDNDGSFSEENDDIRFAISNQNNDIFYSNAERAVDGIKQEKATPEQWRAMIEKAGGLKAGEDKWIGLSDWLAQQRPTVTPQGNETRSQFVERAAAENKRFTLSKQDLLDYIREHKIQIDETHYDENEYDALYLDRKEEFKRYYDEAVDAGEEDPQDVAWQRMIDEYGDDFELAYWAQGDELMRDNDSDYAQWEDDAEGYPRNINETRLTYTTRGLENKREIALTVPTVESWNENDEVHFGDAGEGRAIAWVRFGDAKTISKPEELVQAEQEYEEFSRKMIAQYGRTYTERVMSDSERQQESDLIAKLNKSRKDHPQVEEKVLVIDEIQSKRHQEGREKGYRGEDIREKMMLAESALNDFKARMWNKYVDKVKSRFEIASMMTEEEVAEGDRLVAEANRLRSQWEAERDAIPAAPFEKNWHELAMKRILRFATENGYDKVAWTTGEQQAKRYDIGKEIDHIVKTDENTYEVYPTSGLKMTLEFDENGMYADEYDREYNGKSMSDIFGKDLAKRLKEMPVDETLQGDGLRVGYDGMRGFYDDMLPRFMQKYGKKWGVQVGEVTMPQLEDGYQTMHAIDINDAMRESVLEGQPMFSISGHGVNGTMKPQEGETRSQYIARVAETVKNMTPRNTTIDDAIRFSITVNHNSPYLLKRADGAFVDPETGERLGFDHRFMGKGEGNQAHGWGSYFSVNDLRYYAEERYSNRGKVNTYKGMQYDDVPKTLENFVPRMLLSELGGKEIALEMQGEPKEAKFRQAVAFVRAAISHRPELHDLLPDYYRAELADEPIDNVYSKVIRRNPQELADELLKQLDAISMSDFQLADRHHYSVEIPDNDGTNYIEERQPMNARARKAIMDGLIADGYTMEEKDNGEFGWYEFNKGDYRDDPDNQISLFKEDETYGDFIHDNFHGYDSKMLPKISEYLSKAGIVGIHYDGRRDGECYVIFDENDAVITDHIRFAVGLTPSQTPEYKKWLEENPQPRWNDAYPNDPAKSDTISVDGESYGSYLNRKDKWKAEQKKVLKEISDKIGFEWRRKPVKKEEVDDSSEAQQLSEKWQYTTPILSRSSAVTKALVKQANDSFRLMQSALRKVSADLRTINAIRTQQREYDRKVVDMLLDLYNSLLQENSVWAGYMPDTTRRIATQIVHAIGKKDISAEVNTIMDHMVHAQAKAAQRQWDKLRTTPVDKINISGVVMQGKVALQGQHALKAMNDALDSKATIEQLEDQIAQLMNMEDNATDESLKLQYKGQWIGYTIAAQHLERIQHLVDERRSLELELQDARSNRAIKQSARQQLVANIKQAMRDNYIAQADAYAQSAKDLAEYVTTQEEQAKDFINRQDANRDKIRSYAQRDLEGLATNPNRNRTRGNIVRQIWDAFASPIRDLQSLLRLTGMHAPDGEGYLYNHFMRGWIDGADKERLGIVNAGKTLDAKIDELTHGKYKTWEEAARKINDASHNMFTITMLNGVDGKDMPVEDEIPLNAGNALYIYAVNKMNDGRMKLAGMNITEEDVKALTDKVREQFGQEILDVVDWVQSEYFSQLRNRYNPTHEALFGAPMDAIENYFPLRINANARQQNEDLSEPDTDAARLLAGTSTGAIKRRTRNSLPLDVRNADFFQEVIRHISQMERWNAFAQWNRDANILFSDINFRNRIKGMKGTIYGEGDKLYNYMKDAFRVAIGTYKPKTDTFSEITLNMAKGVTSAKINFRIWTALKQIASFPAFFTYMQDGTFLGSYLRNWLKPHETMKWARENLPNFEKRVSKRDIGDMRLMQRTTDWQWNKRVLEWSQKYGMAANVYFDTLTCATGARAVYDSHLADYLKKGYSEEDARNRARQDAEQAFNTSQQSSEGAFMSAVQQDRNLVTAALTVFRTSPIQYTRNFFYHTRNLLRKFGEGKRDEQIAFRMGQYKNDGLNDEQARKAAEKDYNKSLRQDIVGFVVYGALLNILWRLAGQIPYLLLGDDDDKKKQILGDATSGGAWFSPFTGLLGGGIVESALDGNGSVADMFAPEMPFTQDIKRAGQYLSNNKYAEFASQALSVLMQSGTGFDPMTASDIVSRIVTTLDSEEELDAATQALRVSQALLSIPQSQYEQQLIDRVANKSQYEQQLVDRVEYKRKYDAALADYIRYQKVHTAPLTWWMRGEESDEKAEENAENRFNRLLNERDELHNPEDE